MIWIKIYSLKMRKRYETNEKGPEFRTSGVHTPRSIKAPYPIDFSRQSTTPSRVQERLSSSPLKLPLSKAISRATKRDTSMEKSSSSRYLGRSSRKDQSAIISLAKKIYYDQDSETQMMKAHPETYEFIRKNFGEMCQDVPLQKFIQCVLRDYEYLWGNQNVDKIFDDFTYKIADIFGCDYVDLRELGRITKEDGMIGLILRIFKEVKNEENMRTSNYASFSQNAHVQSINRSFQDRITENESVMGLKNVVQEFMESMYQAMEGEIYSKYNVEMKRMILKYREAEKLLKKTNEKITNYADVIDFDRKMRERQKENDAAMEQLRRQKQKAVTDLQKEKELRTQERNQKERLKQENDRLKENLERYQNIVLNKAMESTEDNFKRNASQSRLTQRPSYQNMRTSQINSGNPEPFKITIDTHITHKENRAPEATSTATFHAPPPPPLSPHRDSYERPPIHTSQISPAHFSSSRVTNFRPVSPYARVPRPL